MHSMVHHGTQGNGEQAPLLLPLAVADAKICDDARDRDESNQSQGSTPDWDVVQSQPINGLQQHRVAYAESGSQQPTRRRSYTLRASVTLPYSLFSALRPPAAAATRHGPRGELWSPSPRWAHLLPRNDWAFAIGFLQLGRSAGDDEPCELVQADALICVLDIRQRIQPLRVQERAAAAQMRVQAENPPLLTLVHLMGAARDGYDMGAAGHARH